MSEATSGRLARISLRSCGLRRWGAFGNGSSILWNLLALLCRLRYEQTMNKSVPTHTSACGEWFRSTGRSAERTRANTFWPNEPKHLVSEPKRDSHLAQTNPTGCANEGNYVLDKYDRFGNAKLSIRLITTRKPHACGCAQLQRTD